MVDCLEPMVAEIRRLQKPAIPSPVSGDLSAMGILHQSMSRFPSLVTPQDLIASI